MGRKPGRQALIVIFFTMLVDAIGFGIILPVMPQLLEGLTGQTLAEATITGGWLLATFAIFQFLCGPLIGNLSDSFGRRPVLLASMAAFAINYALMGFAPNLALLFIGRAIAGIAGAIYPLATSYIADITPPEKRAGSFGLVTAAVGAGFVIGPALGGLLGELGPRAPFLVAAALGFINVIYGFVALPESLPRDRRRSFDWKRANPVGTLIELRRHRLVFKLLGGYFLLQLALQAYSTWPFFTKIQFGWSEATIGMSLAVMGVAMAIIQGFGTGRVVARFGEERVIIGSVICGVAALAILAFSDHTWMAFAALLVTTLESFSFPAVSALMSRQVRADQQGELQGGVASAISFSTIVGPILMAEVLGRFSGAGAPIHFPGAPFLLAALLGLVAVAIVVAALHGPGARPAALPDEGRTG